MKIIVINSAKGGVGKTWVTKGLARELEGNVAIADMDVTTPNIKAVDGVDVHTFASRKIPTKASISRFIKALARDTKNKIDWLLIDTPPTMSETYIAIAEQFENARYLFVTTGDEDAISDTRAGMAFFALRGAKPLGVVQNMLCKEIGLEFDTISTLGADTLAKFQLTESQPISEFKKLARYIESQVLEDGSIKSLKTDYLKSSVTVNDLLNIQTRNLKFYNLETFEYVRDRIVEYETCVVSTERIARSYFDVSKDVIEGMVEAGDSCLVLISQRLGVSRAPRQASIIEVQITYDNDVSKGLPMFITKQGAHLWPGEATIVDDKFVQEVLDGGGVELNSGEVLLNLFETVYIPRAFGKGFTLSREYEILKAWLDDTGADYSKKEIGYLLYKLEDDDHKSFEDFELDYYRKFIEERAEIYAGDFLGHFDRCVALGAEG